MQGFEGHHLADVVRNVQVQSQTDRLNPSARFIGKAHGQLDALHRHDLLVDPGVVQILAAELLGRAHADKRGPPHENPWQRWAM